MGYPFRRDTSSAHLNTEMVLGSSLRAREIAYVGHMWLMCLVSVRVTTARLQFLSLYIS